MNAPAITDFDRQSEYLRLALKYMAEYRVPMTPQNYWVWHEYVSGKNQSLSSELDQAVSEPSKLNSSFMEDLYSRYINNLDFDLFNNVQELFMRTAVSVANALKQAVSDSNRFQSSLDNASQELLQQPTADGVKALVEVLSLATCQMSEGNKALRGKLDESKDEVQKLREELEEVRKECNRDCLTGLANRKAFLEELDKLSHSIDLLEKSCVLFADIDHFKAFNDEYGHLLGDKVINAVARVIEKVVGDQGLAARYGGEEFAVMLPDTDLSGACSIAEDIRSSVERGKVINPRTGESVGRVTISVGVSQFNSKDSIETTLEQADQALYWAKDSGRNRVVTNKTAS